MLVKHDEDECWAIKCDFCGHLPSEWADCPEDAPGMAWVAGFGVHITDTKKLDMCPECRNKNHVKLVVEQDGDGTWVISDDVTLVYGDGTTLLEAIEDYRVSLAEYRALSSTDDEARTQRLRVAIGDVIAGIAQRVALEKAILDLKEENAALRLKRKSEQTAS